ncbi:MAG: T9SS type A sorting domain-containing protein [Bacteroidota bacterium]
MRHSSNTVSGISRRLICLLASALLLAPSQVLEGQENNPCTLISYTPAPGQFINLPASGTPGAAAAICSGSNALVSLGAFGGSVIYKFSRPVINDAENPYGIDLTIFGNPLTDAEGKVRWAEPGIVSVMKDENGNGLPDDTWYEIAGSDHYFLGLSKRFTVTYYNPSVPFASDIAWIADDGSAGMIRANSFYTQPYYPLASLFEGYGQDSVTFSGSRIRPLVYTGNAGELICRNRAFGYADNMRTADPGAGLPDNPYTSETEGCGGDAIDISWAVDEDGNSVELESIDFIKITTAVLEDARWLGELSTEVRMIRDEAPSARPGFNSSMMVIGELPVLLPAGTRIVPEARYFEMGRPVETTVNWSISDAAVAGFSGEALVLKKSGFVNLTATSADHPDVKASVSFEVSEPAAIMIEKDVVSLRTGEEALFKVFVLDAEKREIQGVPLVFSCSDTTVAGIIPASGGVLLFGRKPGTALLSVSAGGYPLFASASITVTAAPETVSVFFGCSTRDRCLLPGQEFQVENFDLEPFVDDISGAFSPATLEGVTLAHVLAAGLENVPFESDLRFRETAGGEDLYLWRYPHRQDGYTEYLYGEKASVAASEAQPVWVVLHNGKMVTGGLEKIPVRNGDEIWLYRVENAALPWTFRHIATDRSQYEQGELCRIKLSACAGSLSDAGMIQSATVSPLASVTITIENPGAKGSFPAGVTDENGEAVIRVEESGEIRFAAGIPEALVRVGTTGLSPENLTTAPEAGPNPFSDIIYFRSGFPLRGLLVISDPGGRTLSQVPLNGETEVKLDGGAFPPGLYLYRIETGEGVFTGKLIGTGYGF